MTARGPRVVLLLGLLCAVTAAAAQTDAKTPGLIRIVVPFSPGGSNDVVARAIAPVLAKRLGNTVIVDNRPGAAGVVGADSVAKAPRDASAILLTSSTFLTTAATQSRVPYDPIAAFAPVAMVAQGPLLVAVPSSASFKSVRDLLAAARARPGALNYGSAGVGSAGQMATELLNAAANIQITHVPYKGAAEALIDLASGRIDLMISNYSSLVPQLKSGRVTGIAVTSQQPSPAFPELPPLAATVPGYAIEIWVGVLAPAGTPAPLIQRLNREINEIALSTELRAFLEPDGATASPMSPAAFAARITEDLAQWKRIASERKITVD